MADIKDKGEIILYKTSSDRVALDVLVENDTVWLTQAQMVMLFERDRTVITKHINNVFKEGELERKSNVHFLHIANSDKPVAHYNLDVIISVGYRVKSQRGTEFRQWATKTLRDYILKGYAVSQRFERLEYRMAETEKKVDFIVRTSLPPKEGVFFDGQIFDAYLFAADLIKSARKTIVLLDNYVDETVLLLLSKRRLKVDATIYTKKISERLQLDLSKHNAQYEPVAVRESVAFHDRFLVIDQTVYHIGASLKDLGKKLFAFSKMEITPTELLKGI